MPLHTSPLPIGEALAATRVMAGRQSLARYMYVHNKHLFPHPFRWILNIHVVSNIHCMHSTLYIHVHVCTMYVSIYMYIYTCTCRCMKPCTLCFNTLFSIVWYSCHLVECHSSANAWWKQTLLLSSSTNG